MISPILLLALQHLEELFGYSEIKFKCGLGTLYDIDQRGELRAGSITSVTGKGISNFEVASCPSNLPPRSCATL